MAKIPETGHNAEEIEAYKRIGVDPSKTMANSLAMEHSGGDEYVMVTWRGLTFITIEEANEILNLREERYAPSDPQ